MKNSFWGLIWFSLIAVLPSWVGVVIAFALTFITWKIPPNTPTPVYWIVLILIIAILIISICLKATNTAFEEYQKLRRRNIPSILFVQKEQNTGFIICLLEYSELFAQDMMISAYYTNKDDIEILIATGFIKNIQSNGKIQVILDQAIPGYQEIIEKFIKNDKSIIDKTIIKPGFKRDILNNLFNQP
jgi:hypothetical protein